MKTLILVDIQNDFTTGGRLEVRNGEAIVPVVNRLQDKFSLVVATQDWHPQNHNSFASNHPGRKVFEKIYLHGLEQVLWPDHCVQNSSGAGFHPELHTAKIEAIIRKGMDQEIDSYSGFFDNGRKKSTGLSGYLKERGASEIYVCGLAGDYCVFFTAKDSLAEGFKTFIVEDAVRSIDDAGFSMAKKEFNRLGGVITTSANI